MPDPNRHNKLEYETDLCIVGGGIVGASIAMFAKEAGINAMILEAREPCLGATGRNAGMLLCGADDNYASSSKRYGRERAKEL